MDWESEYGLLDKPLTKEQIQWVREQMDEGCSLRRLAGDFCKKFQMYPKLAGNQILGMDLCAAANYDWRS